VNPYEINQKQLQKVNLMITNSYIVNKLTKTFYKFIDRINLKFYICASFNKLIVLRICVIKDFFGF
jgi:hypothetical protein